MSNWPTEGVSMLEKRYNEARKSPLKDIPLGELVLIKVEPFTKAALKRDPSLGTLAKAVYVVDMVAKQLKRRTRVVNVWMDSDGFGTPDGVDTENDDLAVWLAEIPNGYCPSPEHLGLPDA